MKELNYNHHKWVKRLVDYNNTKFARHVNKGMTEPRTLCSLFAHTLLTTVNMMVHVLLLAVLWTIIVAVVVNAVGLAITMVAVIFIPYLPFENLHYGLEGAVLFLIFWFIVGGIILIETHKHFKFSRPQSVWTTPLMKLFKQWKGEPKQKGEAVEKQPSLIVEYIKALKNKVCPIITYDEEAND